MVRRALSTARAPRLAAFRVGSLGLVCLGLLPPAAGQGDDPPGAPVGPAVRFHRDVRPILSNRCFSCHGPDASRRKAGLRLDEPGSALRGEGRDGPVIRPGRPLESELFLRIRSGDPAKRMPPGESREPLEAGEVETIRRWIEGGASWEPHWSLVPPVRSEVPEVERRGWARGAVDRFILARLEAEGLGPSPAADRRTLIHRLSLDLTGLPPTPAEVERFLNELRPTAYDDLVERLLASPHHGERMAIHWLDLVRYADSAGYHSDPAQNISPYRDWVIRAFNENLPFDRFTVEQLAGDLLPEPTTAQLVASGYNRLNKTTDEGGAQAEEYLAKYAADRVRTTASVWLGATLGCAECHDHKYDPFTQRDFYSFAAFFADLEERGRYGSGSRPPEIAVPSPSQTREIRELEAELRRVRGRLESLRRGDVAGEGQASSESRLLGERAKRLEGRVEALRQGLRRSQISVAVEPRPVRVLRRGNWMDRSGALVRPAVPRCLPPGETAGLRRRLTRLDLARWLVSPDHPMTARVVVNRLWKLFFGKGLSRTLDDLGSQGEWPVHPELLDWLAVELVESGWDIRHIVRLLVRSSAYRQSSLESEELRRRDPENRLVARQSRFRVEAEVIRDIALSVSGLLTRCVGGPSVKPYQPAGYWAHLNFPRRTYQADTGDRQYRRGLYTHWQRTFLHPGLLAFDAPSREECTAERPISNTPTAALTLLNDPTHVEAARVFAARILLEGGPTRGKRLRWAWREALLRPPRPEELAVLEALLDEQLGFYRANGAMAERLLATGLAPRPERVEAPELAAWTAVGRTLLNLNETITRN